MVMHLKRSRLIIYLTLGSIVIYNSWPLSYLLNPAIAGSGLASDLEAVGQPFNWLFIIGDVISCLLLLAACGMLFARARKLNKKVLTILTTLVVFAVTTALSALIPLNCSGSAIGACGLSASQMYSLHNLLSLVGFCGLFAGMVAAILVSKGLSNLARLSTWVLTIWSLWGLLFLFLSLYSTQTIDHIISVSPLIVACQDVFLVLSSALIFLMIYTVGLFLKTKTSGDYIKS